MKWEVLFPRNGVIIIINSEFVLFGANKPQVRIARMKWLLSLLCCVVLLAVVSDLVEGSGLRAKPTERSWRQRTKISRKPNSVPTQQSKPPTVSFKLTPQKTRKLTSLAGHRVPLTGNLTYWGEYFANVGLGTPPQYVNLQVDTGTCSISFLQRYNP